MWKPKEKDLTPAEAIELAKQELAPFWFGSTPLISGIQTDEGFVVVPLEPSFVKKSWLIFFIDPTEYSGQTALMYAKEWYQRYYTHHLGILMILLPSYSFFGASERMRERVESRQLPFPIVIDADITLAESFGGKSPPKVILLDNNRKHFEYGGKDWLKTVELDIQNFLRIKDPGLAFFPLFIPIKKALEDSRRIEFGYAPRLGSPTVFDSPGFIQTPDGTRVAKFHGLRPKDLEEDQIFVEGDWTQDSEKMMTSDPNAAVIFVSQGGVVSLVAQSLSKTVELPVIAVEVGGKPAHDGISGDDLVLDETGMSVVKVRDAQTYHFLSRLPSQRHEISLKFPNSNVAPVALFGLRLGG